MKTIEEKAKAYDEAIKNARIYYNSGNEDMKTMMETCFPELKESEDEGIRKAIHIYLDWLDGRNKDYQPKGEYSIRDMITWLEKQGEQKFDYANIQQKDFAEKAEPKFKVGDWVTIE